MWYYRRQFISRTYLCHTRVRRSDRIRKVGGLLGHGRSTVRTGGRVLAVPQPRRETDIQKRGPGTVQLPARFLRRSDEPVAEPAQEGRDQTSREPGQRRARHQKAQMVPVRGLVFDFPQTSGAAVRAKRHRRRGHQ